jgi:hypothetical protein
MCHNISVGGVVFTGGVGVCSESVCTWFGMMSKADLSKLARAKMESVAVAISLE